MDRYAKKKKKIIRIYIQIAILHGYLCKFECLEGYTCKKF